MLIISWSFESVSGARLSMMHGFDKPRGLAECSVSDSRKPDPSSNEGMRYREENFNTNI